MTRQEEIDLGVRLEKLLRERVEPGTTVWVPGIHNAAMGGVLLLMAKHALLSEEAKRLLGLD